MNNYSVKTALVTGANSGLGFEAAAQLAEAGWGKVILACRSEDKAEAARARLIKRTGKDPFSGLAVDTAEVASAKAACDRLQERSERCLDAIVVHCSPLSFEPRSPLRLKPGR